MDDIITVVREAIDASGMTDKAVAERIGLDPGLFSHSMNGRRRFTATDFIGLCRVLHISPETVQRIRLKTDKA